MGNSNAYTIIKNKNEFITCYDIQFFSIHGKYRTQKASNTFASNHLYLTEKIIANNHFIVLTDNNYQFLYSTLLKTKREINLNKLLSQV